MRRPAGLLALAMVAAPLGATASAAPVWHFYSEDPSFAFLAVVDEFEVGEAEAYYAFSMSCSATRDWTMRVAGLNHVELGAAIARNEPPGFSMLFDGAADGLFSQYYPDLNFGEMWGEWEYVARWSPGVLDLMLAADAIRMTGPGIDTTLTDRGKTEAVGAFQAACGAIASG